MRLTFWLLTGLLSCSAVAGTDVLEPGKLYSFDDKVAAQNSQPEVAAAILAPAIFTNPRADKFKLHQGRFWQCGQRDDNGQCTHVQFVGYTTEQEAMMSKDEIPMSTAEYRQTQELIEQMMMELRFRGVEDSHPLVQQALERGRSMHIKLLMNQEE